MKTIHFLLLAIAFLAIALSSLSPAKAEMNAQGIVDQFNSASGGTKMQFTYGYSYEVHLTQHGSGFADTSAYMAGVTGGSNYYRTFCVQPNVGAYQNMQATLNYENGRSTTTSGHYLTIGAAYLYSQFAAGTLDEYEYAATPARTTSSSNLMSAIRYLMGIYSPTDWSNPFMTLLLTVNSSKTFWTTEYDPNQYYDVIGNYSVFVMNNTEIGGSGRDGQDFLYVTCATDSSVVPEPTTLLLWGLGTLGTFGVIRNRKAQKGDK